MGEKKAVIIGSGFGGLAAAGLLARDDFNVKVFEKNEQAGGRASVWMKDGFKFDMGPSWYLMPDIFEKYFSEFGKKPEDFMDLKRLDPSYRVFFDEDDIIDIYSDLDKNLETFEKLEKGAKQKFKDYLSTSKYQYDIAMKDFIYKDYKHFYEFFKPKLLVEGTKLHMFSKLDDYAKRFFESEKIRKILEYTIVFLGGSPYKSPALYSLMSHVVFNMGVWYPIGGIGKLVEAMKKVAELQGAEFNFNQAVTKIKSEVGVVKGVETEKGSYDADVVMHVIYSLHAFQPSSDFQSSCLNETFSFAL